MNINSMSAAAFSLPATARRENLTPAKPTPESGSPTVATKPPVDARGAGVSAQGTPPSLVHRAMTAREFGSDRGADAKIEPTPKNEANIQPACPSGPTAKVRAMVGRVNERASMVARLAPELNRLRETTGDLEAIAAKNLIAGLRRSAADQGPYADLANDLMNQTLSEQLGRAGTLGIGPMLYRQLSASLVQQADPTPAKIDARS